MKASDDHMTCGDNRGPADLWCARERGHLTYHVDKDNNVWDDYGRVVRAIVVDHPSEWDTSTTSLGHWRVGTKSPETRRNLWYSPDGTAANETFKGVIFDPEEGPRVAAALNGSHSPELAKALDILSALAKDGCHYDHNNECQEHGFYSDDEDSTWRCPHQRAREMLTAHGWGKE